MESWTAANNDNGNDGSIYHYLYLVIIKDFLSFTFTFFFSTKDYHTRGSNNVFKPENCKIGTLKIQVIILS